MTRTLTLQWRNANVTVERPDGSKDEYARHRAYVDGPKITLRDRRGLELAVLNAVETESVDRRTYRFTSADGEVWTVSKAGCGCGSK